MKVGESYQTKLKEDSFLEAVEDCKILLQALIQVSSPARLCRDNQIRAFEHVRLDSSLQLLKLHHKAAYPYHHLFRAVLLKLCTIHSSLPVNIRNPFASSHIYMQRWHWLLIWQIGFKIIHSSKKMKVIKGCVKIILEQELTFREIAFRDKEGSNYQSNHYYQFDEPKPETDQ